MAVMRERNGAKCVRGALRARLSCLCACKRLAASIGGSRRLRRVHSEASYRFEVQDDVRKYDTKAEHMHQQQQVHQHRDMSAHTDLAASNVPRNWRIARNESKMKALRCLDELSAVSS